MTLAPMFTVDSLVHEAATRAFGDLARKWFSHSSGREGLLAAVEQLGFTDALPSPDGRDAWPTAATLIRAQARSATPIDMALLLATGDRAGSISQPPSEYACTASADPLDSRAALAALSLGRCLQIGAAMEAALELSLQYVQDRKQFGQPLAKFQVIQHSPRPRRRGSRLIQRHLGPRARLRRTRRHSGRSHGSAARRRGGRRGSRRGRDLRRLPPGHGAIGFTQEYALHRHSLDLLRWRDHLQLLRGGELRCAERLGDAALEAGSLWRAVTSVMKPGDSHD